ncbi:MAG: TRAFs-binding domain-containing protein, partial [Bryobacteraceae bacterium]
ETLGLWGAIHKRIWELTGDSSSLNTAIFAYEKGFYLKNDYYNGINLAYLFNERAAASQGQEATADFVLAQRTRRRVIALCEALLNSGRLLPDEYWIRATIAEAWLGLGEKAKSEERLNEAFAVKPEPAQWMRDSTQEQLQKLAKLLQDAPGQKVGATA